MKNIPRLKAEYDSKYKAELKSELKLDNIMQVPALEKIVINVGLGEALADNTLMDQVVEEIKQITGQKPVITQSRKAISGFKLRKGDKIGIKVTLRGAKMWEFFDKLISVVFPRTKDFRGLPETAFDKSGNYTIGIKEQIAFPEIEPSMVKKVRGMEITIVTTTTEDKYAKALLDKFGFPFKKNG